MRSESIWLEAEEISTAAAAALLRLGRYHDALAQTDIAIEAAEDNLADAWFNRAVALEALNDIDGAYDAYHQALALRPGWSMVERELERFSVATPS